MSDPPECPICKKSVEIAPMNHVERVQHVPARDVYRCPYCHIVFYVRDSEDKD
jgi:uncharacterized protein with PIN domain